MLQIFELQKGVLFCSYFTFVTHCITLQEIREWLELKSKVNQSKPDKEDPRSTFETLNWT